MTLNKIASDIAKLEGKKSQARIGDIREILKILIKDEVKIAKENPEGDSMLSSLIDLAAKKSK